MASELEAKLALALESRRQRGIYRELTAASHGLVDFSSNDYLSLSANPKLRDHLLRKLSESDASSILGSGGSRLLDGNQDCHVALEARLSNYFAADTALLFNSGFDANVGVFSVLPQPGDAILYDESIHASVHDGIRASRIQNSAFAFKHNSVSSLRSLLLRLLSDKPSLASGQNSIFIAVEALYSMGGDFAPIQEIVDLVSKVLPMRNGHIIVDEAHTTGVYGPGGRGIVSALHLEDRITVRLHTFGKALACSGAVVLASPLIRAYLINYARPLIYTTALSNTNVIAIGCSLDFLESGFADNLSSKLTSLTSLFLRLTRPLFDAVDPRILSLPNFLLTNAPQDIPAFQSPIIPILTQYPRPLAAYLQKAGYMVRPITHPTVPTGQERVRVCIHAGNTTEDVQGLVQALESWVLQRSASSTGVLLAKM